jgi:hypothetical protein
MKAQEFRIVGSPSYSEAGMTIMGDSINRYFQKFNRCGTHGERTSETMAWNEEDVCPFTLEPYADCPVRNIRDGRRRCPYSLDDCFGPGH